MVKRPKTTKALHILFQPGGQKWPPGTPIFFFWRVLHKMPGMIDNKKGEISCMYFYVIVSGGDAPAICGDT